jgi:uncharacterized tellurite resistance protein B-like protein
MIIFGTRGVKSTIKSGHFHCPQCNQTKPYRHRKVTLFFTLYFIPIIPLGNKGEYVECQECKGTFIPRVLNYNTINKEDSQAIYEIAIKHSMVLIMLADGVIDEKEKKQVQKVINQFSRNKLTLNQLDDYIRKVQFEKKDASTYLKRIAGSLNEHGKEIIIKCALSVSAADGKIDDSELKVISKMAKALEMSGSHLKGIFSEFDEITKEQETRLKEEEIDKEDHRRFMPK